MRLSLLFVLVHVCMRVCVSVYERETEIWGWVYVCVLVDVWDREAVKWCIGVGVQAGRSQGENSDYTCAKYVALSLLIIFECMSYRLFYRAFL